MRIERRVFKYVEYELYNYDNTKREIEFYREKIIEGTPNREIGMNVQSGTAGDPTARKALTLAGSAFLAHAERVISSIDKALSMLSEKHRELFKLKYQECLSWQEVALELGVSDRTYFRMRRELVAAVAQQLGLINIE